MRRRELIAGLGSAGVVVTGGAVATFGLPSVDDAADDSAAEESEGGQTERYEIQTIDARGSDAGTLRLPASDRPTFIDLFATWCPPCIEQMPALAAANERIGDEVLFCSVTPEDVGGNGSLTEAELVDWWAEHDGDWTVGYDPTTEVVERYIESGFPTAVAIDTSGRVQWSDSGIKTADELVSGIELALDASDVESEGDSDPESDADSDE